MRDPFQWSIGVGRWGGVAIRVHVFFLAFAAATFYFAIPDVLSVTAWWMAGGRLLGITSATVAILFVSVLLHELGHWLVARHVGLRPATITIGPLGGLPPWPMRVGPQVELAVLAAGPLVNLLLALVLLTAVLVMRHPDVDLRSLWNPFQPAGTLAMALQMLTIGLWINWLLLVLNVLPAHPFDGRRMLHAALRLVRPTWSDRRVAEWVCRVAIAVAITVAIAAAVLAKYYADPNHADTPFPVWGALVLLAVLLLVSARRELNDVEVPLVDEESVAGEDEESVVRREAAPRAATQFLAPAVADAHWGRDADASEEPDHREEIEAQEERLVDGILSRLHAHGIESLTADERALLDRVSARYRSRLGRRM